MTAFQQNCSVLWCAETMKGAAVDPDGDLDRIFAAAKEHHVEIEKTLVTHGHIDHSGNAAELAAQLDVSIEGPHSDDSLWIDLMTEQGEQRDIAGTEFAIIGDVLFQGSVGRADFPRGNHAVLIHSITTRLWPLGDDTAFVPGHGQMSNFAAGRQSSPFASDVVSEASTA